MLKTPSVGVCTWWGGGWGQAPNSNGNLTCNDCGEVHLLILYIPDHGNGLFCDAYTESLALAHHPKQHLAILTIPLLFKYLYYNSCHCTVHRPYPSFTISITNLSFPPPH